MDIEKKIRTTTMTTTTTTTNLWFYAFILMGAMLIAMNSCKEDESEDKKTVKDIDGNVYSTVVIGNQEWLAENLRVTRYNDGTSIPTGFTNIDWSYLNVGAYTIYPHTDINELNSEAGVLKAYGALYNWYAVETGNLCPMGWHVPTNDEWYTLETYVDPTIDNLSVLGWLGSDGGTKLKTNHRWVDNGNGTDDFGFSALPSGRRRYDDGTFDRLGIMVYWWSSSPHSNDYAWYRSLHNEYTSIGRQAAYRCFGFSVRCVKDN